MAAADVSDEAMFSAEEDFGDEENEEECRICLLPAKPARPLRRPCACSGSIRFVHDDCQLQWIATRHQQQCEVCHHVVSIRLLYAVDAPSRLPVYELMVGLPDKLMGLLFPLVFAICVLPEFVVHLTNLWAWRLALARSFGQVHYLLFLRLSTASVLALFAILVAFEHWFEVFDVAPFARWVARLETRYEGFEGLQVLAIYAVEAFLMVVIFDMALACMLGFLPSSLGRITLWCISCFSFCTTDEVNSYPSTTSVLLTGYGFIISVGVIFVGLNTFCQNLRGERLMITIFLRGIKEFITVVNICLKLLFILICPLLFGWSLDICTSKMVGETMSKRFKLLFASSFASTALYWLIGTNFLNLYFRSSRILHKILRPGVVFPSGRSSFDISFYTFIPKMLHLISFGIMFMVVAIFVPIQISDYLAPDLFPLDIKCFICPIKALSFWQVPRNYADSVSRVLLLRFLTTRTNTLLDLGWLVKKVTRHSFATNVVLAWLTVVILNSAGLIFSISMGRALLFSFTRLPLAGGLKSNDLLAFVVGYGIISIIIEASIDSFAYMTSEKVHFPALSCYLVSLLWGVIVPFLVGSLVDLLLIPLLAGPDDDVSVFYIWCMGYLLLRIWLELVVRMRATPFLAYFVDERWGPNIDRFMADMKSEVISPCWFFQEIFMPMATKLLTALGVPYVIAKGIFPKFGYSAAANSAVYRFAWLGILGFCALCYLAKVFCIELHGSIRDDHYVIGKRVEDVADKRGRSR